MLQEQLFGTKSSKVFWYLELGILPAKYMIMRKRLKFLKYIIDEPIETMIRKVFEEQRRGSESRGEENLMCRTLDKAVKEEEHAMRRISRKKIR